MEEEAICSVCSRPASQVRLLDAIDNNEIIKICEECSLTEDIPIIRKPSSFQLKTNEKIPTVYQRLSRLAGIKTTTPEQDKVQEAMRNITLAKPIATSQLSIKQKQELAKKANQPLDLVDNFHWHIQMARKKRKITQRQLAEAVGEQEEIIKMIESSNLPDDASRIIKKIGQYLAIKLAKTEYEAEQNRLSQVRHPARVLSFNPEALHKLTISDLIEMKKQKEQIKLDRKKEEKNVEQKEDKEEIFGDDIEIIDE